MAVYAVGDIQGCAGAFEKILTKINFDPGRDQVWLCGDLVNRGPNSLEVLRTVRRLGDSAVAVLGNHDLHFLSVAAGIRHHRTDDTLKTLLKAPDIEELISWLRQQPLVHCDEKLKTIMTHAGVYPAWTRNRLMDYSKEIETILQGEKCNRFLKYIYGNQPTVWDEKLTGKKRRRFIVNCLTRMRYCDSQGKLDFSQKGAPGAQQAGWIPWYMHPHRKISKWRIVFGHWSTLGYLQYQNIISLDSGCVWGGRLTAVQLDADYIAPKWQVKCGK